MQLNKIVWYLAAFFIQAIFCISYALADTDPVAMLQSTANHMIEGLKTNQATLKTKPQVVFQLANKYIVPNAALTDMSKGVLPPHIWNQATNEQRAQFEKEFTTTLIRTYASALTSYRNQTVHFYPLRGAYQGKSAVDVNSEIVSPDNDPIHVSYHVVRKGNVWKLYDISVEGVDMLESFRSQFSDILANGSMNQLLQRMVKHNQNRRG